MRREVLKRFCVVSLAVAGACSTGPGRAECSVVSVGRTLQEGDVLCIVMGYGSAYEANEEGRFEAVIVDGRGHSLATMRGRMKRSGKHRQQFLTIRGQRLRWKADCVKLGQELLATHELPPIVAERTYVSVPGGTSLRLRVNKPIVLNGEIGGW